MDFDESDIGSTEEELKSYAKYQRAMREVLDGEQRARFNMNFNPDDWTESDGIDWNNIDSVKALFSQTGENQ